MATLKERAAGVTTAELMVAPFEIHETAIGMFRLFRGGKHVHDFDDIEKAKRAIQRLANPPVVHKFDADGKLIE